MKITLINPPQVFTRTQVTAGVFPPLNLAYIASFLESKNHKVQIIDAVGEDYKKFIHYKENIFLRGLSFADIIKKTKNFNPNLIGISNTFTFAYPSVKQLIEKIKKELALPIVIGGTHPSIDFMNIMKNSQVDYVVISEGEETMLNIVKYLEGRGNLNTINGFVYRKNGRIIVNPKTEFIKNLDSLPFPDRELLPMKNYFESREAHGSVKKKRWVPIISSRGCPYNCSYCPTAKIWQRRWRGRSAENIADEIEECIEKWGIKEIHFNDENMSVDRKRMIEICQEIIKRRLDIVWQTPNGMRIESLTKKIIALMKKSGCYHITVAPESGSRRVLKLMNKTINLKQIKNTVKWCKEKKIRTASFFILGFPGETKKDIDITLKYSRLLMYEGLDEVSFSIFTPLLGAEISKHFKINSYEDFLAMGDLGRKPSWFDEKQSKYLKNVRLRAYILFNLMRLINNPVEIIGSIKNIVQQKQETKTERFILNLLKYWKIGSGDK